MGLPQALTPEIWLAQVFSAQAVNKGGVVRRAARDVDRLIGRDVFLDEVRRRGFHAIENNGQILVFCNNAGVRVLA